MTLVDTNVLLDLLTDDARWEVWSRYHLDAARVDGPLAINDVIYAELSVRFFQIEPLNFFLAQSAVIRMEFSQAALFAAGKAFQRYRAAGGTRASLLPDFFIGAQAEEQSLRLLTRDPARYRTFFPTVKLITPAI